jgi:hypothetical protein
MVPVRQLDAAQMLGGVIGGRSREREDQKKLEEQRRWEQEEHRRLVDRYE